MSIVALARHRADHITPPVERKPLRGAEDGRGADLSALENVVRQIPSDALALYTAGIAFLANEKSLYRWLLVALVAGLAVALAVGVYRRQILANHGIFHWPVPLAFTVLFAFAVYVFAIPGSPFNDFGWYTPAIAGTVAILGNGVLVVIALWTTDD